MGSASIRARRRRAAKRAAKRGLPPGTPVYTGEVQDVPVHVQVIDYGPHGVEESTHDGTAALAGYRDTRSVTWINLDGVHEVEQVQALGELFGLHPLWVEDIVNPSSRPKIDQIGDLLLVIARMAHTQTDDGSPRVEQVSIVKGPHWVLTFQEREGDVWDPLRGRIQGGTGRIRRMGADYLLHALLDGIVDHYFLGLEQLEARVDVLEEEAATGDAVELPVLFALKRELAEFRRMAWPMREAVSGMLKSDGVIGADVMPFMRDLYDHVVQVMDIVETSRERVGGVFELHIAVAGLRLNEIMRVLTIVSTIFIPITFIAGVYGMNFEHMPELGWRWSYPVALGSMALCVVGGLWWMRRRGWMS